jgi:hypothetical protein
MTNSLEYIFETKTIFRTTLSGKMPEKLCLDFSVYNRLNPWYHHKKGDQMKQITLFPVIPSVSFTYRW